VAQLTAHAERYVAAPPGVVYRCLADYREHHHRFLPPQFHDYRVEEGGYGAGTVVAFTTTVAGRDRRLRVRIGEPEPGRVLTETDTLSPLATTTTVTADGPGTRVRFETAWTVAGGPAGVLERLVAPWMMRRMYADELARLDRYAAEQGPAG
jgi:uncharacterized protein YndB with AHSA1/START domain